MTAMMVYFKRTVDACLLRTAGELASNYKLSLCVVLAHVEVAGDGREGLCLMAMLARQTF